MEDFAAKQADIFSGVDGDQNGAKTTADIGLADSASINHITVILSFLRLLLYRLFFLLLLICIPPIIYFFFSLYY